MSERWIRRLWLFPAAMLVIITGAFAAEGITGVYERYFNPVPFIAYDYDGRDGMPTDKPEYRPGDPVSLHIERCLRVNSTLRNVLYLSMTTSPSGRQLMTLDAYAPAGCTERDAIVATLPADTRAGIYRITGAQTVSTKWGSSTVPWYSTAFYVDTD